MSHIKLQLGCLAVLLYIAFIYFRECRQYKIRVNQRLFDELLLLGIVSVLLDGATAYTVNHLDTVPPVLNMALHALFLISLDSVIFVLCLYMLHITGTSPRTKPGRVLVYAPFVVNIGMVVLHIPDLEYRTGAATNYSMGVSAYTCFIVAGFYILLSIGVFVKCWNSIEPHKRVSISTYLLVLALVTGFQMVFPEALITSIAVTVFVLGVYMNLEAPALLQLSAYHKETVMAFATLIENRDRSTGGHIKRTSAYVQLIAHALRERGCCLERLTTDYITNLVKAAPMHDIGKVSVPDAILQKPGKLTDQEFETMKLHTIHGGAIIQETFRNLGDEEYRQIAYEVARHHHERWNGKGYPDGLKGEDIPLCARIMAVADVFDAISENRCYRSAMPLELCFDIIQEGRGRDFDPVIVDAFLAHKEQVIQVHDAF